VLFQYPEIQESLFLIFVEMMELQSSLMRASLPGLELGEAREQNNSSPLPLLLKREPICK